MTNDHARRIERLDRDLHAFLAEPDRTGRLDADPTPGPLAGVAVGVKDVYRVDGLPTRAGSRLPPDLFAGPESTVVTRLRAAGAVIAGKTAMDEFAYCEPPATKNPRDPRRTPGGSSGGSAAAVAAGLCPVALGSQTLQSVIVPAAYCGVLGFKPTYQRARFDGIPLAPSFDTIGLLAESASLLAIAAAQAIPDWRGTKLRTDQDRKLITLGVPPPWGLKRLHAEGWAAFAAQVELLRGAGFSIRSAGTPWNEELDRYSTIIGDLVHGELARVHAGWYPAYQDLYRPRTRAAVERGLEVSDDRLAECRGARDTLVAALQQTTEDNEIDCWICPATGSVAPIGYDRTGDSWLTSFWSYAGWPQLTIPIFDGEDGLPHGLQCIGPAGSDEDLLTMAMIIAAAL